MSIFIRPEAGVDQAREQMRAAWRQVCDLLELCKSAVVDVTEAKDTRTAKQNRLMWSVLGDIARQVEWPVDGKMQHLTAEDWKDIITAGVKKHQRVAQGIGGGFVMLGARTSKMTIAEMTEVIEFAYWFGAERETPVVWTIDGSERAA